MRSYTAVVETSPGTGLYVGHIPGFRGAHSQGDTIEEVTASLREVVGMLLEDSELALDGEIVITATVKAA